MRFNAHSEMRGKHAFLAPSKYHWINYSDDKLDRAYLAAMAAQRGTELHELAHNMIRLGVKLPRSSKTLNLYVNDCIGYRMTTEQTLCYSEFAFGSADAISFRDNVLRISDLKTGMSPTSEHQLEVYTALFCLEYGYRPTEIKIELRIYQNDEVRLYVPDPLDIAFIMDKIITFDRRIRTIREETM